MFLEQQKENPEVIGLNGRENPHPIFGENLPSEIQTFEAGFNTSAHLEHFSPEPALNQDSKKMKNPGKKKSDPQKNIDKRAKRKGFAVALAKVMTEFAEKTGSPMLGTYQRAMSCCGIMYQVDGKITAKYCQSASADLITTYSHFLQNPPSLRPIRHLLPTWNALK